MPGGRRDVAILAGAILLVSGAVLLLYLPDDLVAVLGVIFTALCVVVAWLSWPDSQPASLGEQLASAVQRQCDLDAEANQLNDPNR